MAHVITKKKRRGTIDQSFFSVIMRGSLCRFVLSDEPREIERIKEQLSIRWY